MSTGTTEAGRFTANNSTQAVNILQNSSGSALVASAPTPSGGIAILGQATGTSATCCSIGVEGTGVGAAGYGVIGSAQVAGVERESSSTGGIGVIGVNFLTSGSAVGVQGLTESPAGVAGEFLKQTSSFGTLPALGAANGGTFGEAAWFGLTNGSNPSDALKLVLPSGSKSNFIEGDLPDGNPLSLVDANGNITTSGGLIGVSGSGQSLSLKASDGNAFTAPNGGNVTINAGNAASNGAAGNIVLTPGAVTGGHCLLGPHQFDNRSWFYNFVFKPNKPGRPSL